MTRQQMLSRRSLLLTLTWLGYRPEGLVSSCRAAHTRGKRASEWRKNRGRIISLAGSTARESRTAANWKRCLHARACHRPSTKRVRTRAVTAGRVGRGGGPLIGDHRSPRHARTRGMRETHPTTGQRSERGLYVCGDDE
jgi:hypothetical protein